MCRTGTKTPQKQWPETRRAQPRSSIEPDHGTQPPPSIAVSALSRRGAGRRSAGHPGRGRAAFDGFGVDATQLGVGAGGGTDQTAMLQAAVDKAAGARVPLMLWPGDYRAAGLEAAELPPRSSACRGATAARARQKYLEPFAR